LVIEDDLGLGELYTRVLDDEGVQAVISRTGHDAVQLVEQHEPRLVILDLMLPGMYGTSVASALQAKWRKLPIIMISALPNMTVAQDAWASRAFAYLTKPFELGDFSAAVRKALNVPACGQRLPDALQADRPPSAA
jgi:DNA-binding response OmpR family regulator